MSDELLPCPFCGGVSIDIEEIKSTNGETRSYMFECNGCDAIGPGMNLSLDAGKKAWNTRHSITVGLPVAQKTLQNSRKTC